MNSAADVICEVAEVPATAEYPFRGLSAGNKVSVGAIAPQRFTSWAGFDGRRALNVVAAVIGLIVAAPLMLVIAILIKLSSPGPIFYTQTRVGLDRRNGDDPLWRSRRKVDFGGRLFAMYKFRTMRAGDDSVQIWARHGDDRITPIGNVLRKYRLDELPQLVNVLKGDMNIVGPRPEQPKIFETLREEVEYYSQRQRVLPGITGWAQINQSYDTSLDDVRRKVQ
ncbi:MAG TPA: sugar transferase, partial [Longimicrobiaceae bacterium]|nr:sugar transferase [Longimicrobiaceae bacterium]